MIVEGLNSLTAALLSTRHPGFIITGIGLFCAQKVEILTVDSLRKYCTSTVYKILEEKGNTQMSKNVHLIG